VNSPHPSGRLLPAARLGTNSRARLLNPAPTGTYTRTDQGVDWKNITGNIRAVASGTIVNIYQNLSGFGTTVIERLQGGQEVYYAGETGAGAPVVQQGEQVQAGQEIAPGLGTGGVEIGYWNPLTGHAVGYQPGVTSGGVTAAGTQFQQDIGSGGGSGAGNSSSIGKIPTWVPVSYRDWVQGAAQGTGLPAALVAAQIQVESHFNPNVTSPAGAQGIAQFMPTTFKAYGKGSPYNPTDAQGAYINYMNYLLSQYNGNVRDALAAYNAGQGNIQAGYGYADGIMKSAGVSSSATDTGGYGGTRPGGQPVGASQQASGVTGILESYRTLRDTPRTAPPGTANPFQWFQASFTGNWDNLGGSGS